MKLTVTEAMEEIYKDDIALEELEKIMERPEMVYVVHYRDSKYRESGILSIWYDKENAEEEAERLNEKDFYSYIYWVVDTEIK